MTQLIEEATDVTIELCVAFVKECGQFLTENCFKALDAICSSLRKILHEGTIDIRIQFMIEVLFKIRKDGKNTIN